MKTVSILGATGSIGDSAFAVIDGQRDDFQIVAITGGQNVEKLAQRARNFNVQYAVIADESLFQSLKSALSDTSIKVSAGRQAILEAASLPCDVSLSVIIGAAGVEPSLAAAKAAKRLALANKETLVAAGQLMLKTAQYHNCEIIPVDSEHSGVFQAVQGHDRNAIQRVTLTASGGAFLDWTFEQMQDATPQDALKHPTYAMGARITVDSASMFNKAMELIEAQVLFDLKPSQIKSVIHPGSIVHAMVSYQDGSTLAHMGHPDMRHAIAYGLTYPHRACLDIPQLDFAELGNLEFRAMDHDKFPAVSLAYWAMEKGGLSGAALNGAKEKALDHFMAGEIRFTEMAVLVEKALLNMDADGVLAADPLAIDAITEIDLVARDAVTQGMRNG